MLIKICNTLIQKKIKMILSQNKRSKGIIPNLVVLKYRIHKNTKYSSKHNLFMMLHRTYYHNIL